MSDVVDRITKVLGKHYVWDEYIDAGDHRVRCRCDVDDPHMTNSVPDGGWMPFGEWAAHAAERVAAELQLTEEWAVDERGILGKWHKTQQSAQKHCDTIVRNFWVTHKAVSGAALAEPHPTPVRRWVSAYTAVGGKSL